MYPMNGFTDISHRSEGIARRYCARPPGLLVGNDYFKLSEINLAAISADTANNWRAVNGAAISGFKAWDCMFDVWKRTKAEYAETVSTFHSSGPTDALDIVSIESPIFVFYDELSLVRINRVQ